MSRALARSAGVAAFLLVSAAAPAKAQNCSPVKPEAAGGETEFEALKFLDSNDVLGDDLTAAVGSWNSPCGGEDIPDLLTSGSGDYTVNILSRPGNRPVDPSGEDRGCGRTTVMYNSAKTFLGATIEIWENQSDGTSCSGGLTAVLAHEIGHVLGLGHATDAACKDSLMYNASLNPNARPTDIHCNSLDSLWKTPDDPLDLGDIDHPCRNQPA